MKSLEIYYKEISSLYLYQELSLMKILAHNNTLTIAPTGGGKSLIFQLAALELEGTTIVVSPLKALMDDQINDLEKRGISALSINSDLSFIEQRQLMKILNKTCPKIIYVSPERLSNYYFRSALKLSGLKISLVVIDEAHCISQWGIDFRPEYSNIKPFISYLKSFDQDPIVFALTATLGEEARKDIKSEFVIEDSSEIISNNVIRENIIFNFLEVQNEEEKWDKLNRFISEHNLKKVIVYLYSQKKCEDFSRRFPGSDFYHADTPPDRKASIMQDFKSGKIKVLFATTAFGMGINIPDIDGIIHYQIPSSVEEFYQHVGRGARDKELCPLCWCLFLWSSVNFDREARRIKSQTLTCEKIKKGFSHLGLENNSGKKSYIRWEEIYNNDGTYGSVNLSLILNYFIRYDVCSIVGDIYGNPKDIEFKKITDLWVNVINQLGNRNQFLLAEKKTGISISELIDHVYEQELIGNITKLPATNRLLFLKSNYDQVPDTILQNIIDEGKKVETFKLYQLQQMLDLCKLENNLINDFIAKTLGVPR